MREPVFRTNVVSVALRLHLNDFSTAFKIAVLSSYSNAIWSYRALKLIIFISEYSEYTGIVAATSYSLKLSDVVIRRTWLIAQYVGTKNVVAHKYYKVRVYEA